MVLHAVPAHAHATALLRQCRAQAEPGVEPGAAGGCPPLTEGLRLEGVGYHHDRDRPPALTAISARIPARQVTALVGPSGAGKSTLADLLLGLTAPSEGTLFLDGAPLEGALRRAWRRQVGYVPQDGFLFHDTIRANLVMVAPAADDDAVWQALEQAAAADFVRNLPQGLATVVGDRGARLSGGERQRLALARALLVKPSLLILDEATSALDVGNERQILDALDRLRGQLTMVVVAHRRSTVQGADHVLVLHGGRLVVAGTWAQAEAVHGLDLIEGDAP
jgi:ATP-binding cassette subfamily C protein